MIAVTVAVSAILSAALIVLTQVVMARASHSDSHRLAAARAQGVAAALDRHGSRVVLPNNAVDSDRGTWVLATDGTVLDGRLSPMLAPVVRGTARAGVDRTALGLLLHPLAARVRGIPINVVSSVDLAPYEDSERHSLLLTIGLGLAAVVMAGVSASEVARISLGKVHEMSAKADDWQEHDLAHRFNLGPPVDEIGELGQTMDRMLARIATALADERCLTDEVAHELRTPLTVVRSEAQLAMHAADQETRAALERIVTATDAMTASIRTMLESARARVDTQVTPDLVAVVANLDVGVQVSGPGGVAVRLSPATLAALLRPVLDNAWRHAESGVSVQVLPSDPVSLTVHDDGPGFNAESAERAFDPGWSGTASSGLGLAVVRRIAASAGAQVRAIPGDGGRVELLLPPG